MQLMCCNVVGNLYQGSLSGNKQNLFNQPSVTRCMVWRFLSTTRNMSTYKATLAGMAFQTLTSSVMTIPTIPAPVEKQTRPAALAGALGLARHPPRPLRRPRTRAAGRWRPPRPPGGAKRRGRGRPPGRRPLPGILHIVWNCHVYGKICQSSHYGETH